MVCLRAHSGDAAYSHTTVSRYYTTMLTSMPIAEPTQALHPRPQNGDHHQRHPLPLLHLRRDRGGHRHRRQGHREEQGLWIHHLPPHRRHPSCPQGTLKEDQWLDDRHPTHRLATKNRVFRSFIGIGYHDTFIPTVILQNIRTSWRTRRGRPSTPSTRCWPKVSTRSVI